MVQYDDVQSLSKKLIAFFSNMNTSTMLIMTIMVAVIALLMGAVSESVLTAQTVLTVLMTTVGIYIYFKKQYSQKIKTLKLKNKLLKKNSVLDELCGNKKTRKTELCNRYHTSKQNFYTISNMLLQRYNIDD
jgi:hypothetical protein